ncbi:GntR family transcriptional regulator [Bacteroides sp.]|uniref:GntR family transcriptional regulator n=1 Tax=Bacteroides sp. TaxID=29523 RepID=UPI0023D0B087|nr:GntR family transcriptional regulator [Bacteroides sp.]MDE5709984.1 GntR family transcriptional regulator [Bacteroides sp.]MDE6215340.1 GntR family transcriptional regulator [Bacteroides sp.]
MRDKVNFGQQSTKVKQLSDIIEQDIMMGKYKTDTGLPSINSLSKAYNVSRDTVFKAFSDLRERKLIDSTPGKGYYVKNRQEKIFLLLDEYSPFKNTLYNSFVRRLSTSYKVDLWFHQYNEHIFNTILHEAIGRYNYYVVMNFDNARFSPLFHKINPSRLLLLDFGRFEKENYSYICQNFDDEFYNVLVQLTGRLKKYRKIIFQLPVDSKHPRVSADSFRQYCRDNDFISEISELEDITDVEKEVAYIVIRQTDVVNIIKRSREKGMKCGRDFGIIAYNDTPAYEVIDDGITALSVNWDEMGRLAAKFILTGEAVQTYLHTEVHLRSSV